MSVEQDDGNGSLGSLKGAGATRPRLPRRRVASDRSIAEAGLRGSPRHLRDSTEDQGQETGHPASGDRRRTPGPAEPDDAPNATPEPGEAVAALAAEIPWTRAPWALTEGARGSSGRTGIVGSASATGRPKPGRPTDAADAADADAPEVSAPDGAVSRRRPGRRTLLALLLASAVVVAVPLVLVSAGGEKEGAAESPAAGSTQAEGPEEGVGAAGRVALEPSASEESSKTSRGEKPTSGSGPSAGSTGGKSAGQTALDGQDTSGTQKKAGSKKAAGGEKAPYWEDIERHVSNAHTGKCLVAGADRVVAQSECGTSGAWRRLVVGDGVFLLKYVPADACLDSNGEEMYVSPCTTDDPGQLWRMPSSDHCEVAVSSKQYGEFVTGWNTGSVSLVGAELADEAAKHSWTLSPSLSAGC